MYDPPDENILFVANILLFPPKILGADYLRTDSYLLLFEGNDIPPNIPLVDAKSPPLLPDN